MKYAVDYQSGDGIVNGATYTYAITQTGSSKDSVICFKSELQVSDGTPKRKTYAPIVRTAIVTIAKEDQWRSEADFRLVHKYVTQTNLPIVGTLSSDVYYRDYSGYPGWPYALNQTWSYKVFTSPSHWLVRSWTDSWSAKVVSDAVEVMVGAINYTCFEVVHTITATDASPSPGSGVGGTIIEYWIKSGILSVPVKEIDESNFVGREIRKAVPFGQVIGSGNVSIQTTSYSPFTDITVSGDFDIEIIQSSSHSLTVSADDNVFAYLQILETGGQLSIGLKWGYTYQNVTLKAKITLVALNILKLSGGTHGSAKGFLSSQNFTLTSCDSSSIVLEGAATNLLVSATQGSRLVLSNFLVHNATIDLRKGSEATINLDGRLIATVRENSTLYYAGNPTLVQIETSGNSTVNRL